MTSITTENDAPAAAVKEKLAQHAKDINVKEASQPFSLGPRGCLGRK